MEVKGCKTLFEVTLKALVACGALHSGKRTLSVEARDKIKNGDLLEDGTIKFEGKTYLSLSSFAVAALRSAGAKNRTTANGWQIVMYKNRTLETYRREYFEATSGQKATIIRSNASSKQLVQDLQAPEGSKFSGQLDSVPSGMESSTSESASNPSANSSSPANTRNAYHMNFHSDMWSCSLSTRSRQEVTRKRKREPNPELTAWLKKALKKRYADALSFPNT